MRFPVGTLYKSSGKYPRVCKVVDYHITKNMKGEIVRERYVTEHEFLGKSIKEFDITETEIARGVVRLAEA